MKHPIDLTLGFERLADVVFDKLKSWITEQMLNVFRVACDQVIYGNDGVTPVNQPIAEVRPDEAGGSGNQITQIRAP
jgi:hypothetical protein